MPKVDRVALALALCSAPLKLALLGGTDLSPDEAYYLAAARLRVAIPDHPPLLVWLLRLTDPVHTLPVEWRVRLWPFALSLLTSWLLLRRMSEQGACAKAQRWTGLALGWLALPLASGFLATPDVPALALFAAIFVLATVPSWREHRAASLIALLLAFASGAAKVSSLPIVLLLAAAAPLSRRVRLGLGLGALASLVLGWQSLGFQLHHAYGPSAWPRPLDSLGAVLGAVGAQAGLWTPFLLTHGLRKEHLPAREDRWVIAGLAALLFVSALVRGVPPEPNWFAPAALVLTMSLGRALAQASKRVQAAFIALGPALALLFAAHTLRPWLPLPPHADPAARLHGWSGAGPEPLSAPGIGAYGPAAERCIYRDSCTDLLQQLHRP